MPNMELMLENVNHLLPLLQNYLGYLNPEILTKPRLDDVDYEFIQNPNGSISAFKPDVISEGRAGSFNIAEGYWRALAQALKRGVESVEQINVISVINHSQSHWTCSVAEMLVDKVQYQILKETLNSIYSKDQIAQMDTFELQHFIQDIFSYNIFETVKLQGVNEIRVNHYDSHNPNNEEGGYYKSYKKTLDTLIEQNAVEGPAVTITSKPCKKQSGMACGDNSLYNGFTAGVLGLDAGNPENQIDSHSLRSYTEAIVKTLKANVKDADMVQNVTDQLKTQVQNAKNRSAPLNTLQRGEIEPRQPPRATTRAPIKRNNPPQAIYLKPGETPVRGQAPVLRNVPQKVPQRGQNTPSNNPSSSGDIPRAGIHRPAIKRETNEANIFAPQNQPTQNTKPLPRNPLSPEMAFKDLPPNFKGYLREETKEAVRLIKTTVENYWNKIAELKEKQTFIADFKSKFAKRPKM